MHRKQNGLVRNGEEIGLERSEWPGSSRVGRRDALNGKARMVLWVGSFTVIAARAAQLSSDSAVDSGIEEVSLFLNRLHNSAKGMYTCIERNAPVAYLDESLSISN